MAFEYEADNHPTHPRKSYKCFGLDKISDIDEGSIFCNSNQEWVTKDGKKYEDNFLIQYCLKGKYLMIITMFVLWLFLMLKADSLIYNYAHCCKCADLRFGFDLTTGKQLPSHCFKVFPLFCDVVLIRRQ